MKKIINAYLFIKIAVCVASFVFFMGCNKAQMYEENGSITAESSNETDYYWSKGEKIYLKKNSDKQYVLYKGTEEEKTPILKRSNTNSIFSKESNELTYTGIVMTESAITKIANIKWIIADDTKSANIGSVSEIIYQSPFYISTSGLNVGISHLFYVKLKSLSDKDMLYNMASEHQLDVIGYNEYLPKWYTLSCNDKSDGDALKMANLFYETGLFESSEPDIMVDDLTLALSPTTKAFTPNDPNYNSQWNLVGTNSINWTSAYELTQGNNIKVAVIDQGIEQLHQDFNNNIYPSYDTHTGAWYATNIYGNHGTACAGIIGAAVNNNKGIAGIAPNAKILDISNPLTPAPNTIQELATGIAIAIRNADVVSNSWGGAALTSSLIEDAIYEGFFIGRMGKGAIMVFSTGNDNGSVKFPANNIYKDVLAVGSINKNGRRSSFSNYGSELDVVAPGEYIPTTDLSGKYGYSATDYFLEFDGTSAACPHVAGVAALILSVNNNLTYREVAEIIEKTARKVGGYNYSVVAGRPNGTWNIEMGYGLIDAYAAILEAKRRL